MSVTIQIQDDGMTATVTNGEWTSEDTLLIDLLTKATRVTTRQGCDSQIDYALAQAACAQVGADVVYTEYEGTPWYERIYRVY